MIKKIYKKIFHKTALFIAFPFDAIKAQIFQGPGTTVPDTQAGLKDVKKALDGSGITSTGDIGDLILKYVNFILPYLAIAAFLGFVYAGILYIVAFGNEEQTQKSKKILIYTSIGLILIILSYSIVQLLTGDLVKGIQN